MKKPETRLHRKIQQALGEIYPGAFFRKIHGNQFQDAGIPDLLGCIKGRFCGIEVKMPGKDPSEIQLDTLAEIEAAGGVAGVAYCLEDALRIASRCVGSNKNL